MSSLSSLLLSNLQLLNIVTPDTKHLTPHLLSAEITLYSLLQAYSTDLTSRSFSHCWPIHDPLQAKEFKIQAYKVLLELKTTGVLSGNGVVVRKSLLEDRQGERYELLLLALSTYVLKQRLRERETGDWSLAREVTLYEGEWNRELQLRIQVWCLVCEYVLSKDVCYRRTLREKTSTFSALLRDHEGNVERKEKNLNPDIEFGKVVRESENEYSRWTKHWIGLQGEWFLQTLQQQLSSIPPKEFLSQSYTEAFLRQTPITQKKKASIVHASSTTSQSQISALQDKELDLKDEIIRLEKELAIHSPQRNGVSNTPGRSSLPSTPSKAVKTSERRTSERNGLAFLRKEDSSAVKRRSVSESPRGMSRVHGNSVNGNETDKCS